MKRNCYMPKLNDTHLIERLKEVIEQLKRGEEVEAKKNKSLLSDEQQLALEEAWSKQQALRKQHKPPKTEEEKQRIGWKDKREVRIEIYKKRFAELTANALDDIKELQKKREQKAARVFMDAWSKALKEGKETWSAISEGNIAMTRAGFRSANSIGLTKRDKEVNDLEDALRKQLESEMTAEEREQYELLKEHEKAVKKQRKV